MKWFHDASTRMKLFFGFGLIIVLLLIVTATAYRSITAIEDSQQRLYEVNFADAVDLLELRSDENGIRAAQLDMMLSARRSDQEAWHRDIQERSKDIDRLMPRLLARNRSQPAVLQRLEE